MQKPLPQIISQEAAHSLGLRRYFTGAPCHRGHISERYVSSGGCIACMPNKRFEFRRNAFSHDLEPYTCNTLWLPRALDIEERVKLDGYIQRCIVEYLKQRALLTVELEEAFALQLGSTQR